MAEMMVGSTFATPARTAHAPGEVALEVEELSLPAPSAFGTALKSIGFTVRRG
jgi:simple sugar transport system ATP-binding protein